MLQKDGKKFCPLEKFKEGVARTTGGEGQSLGKRGRAAQTKSTSESTKDATVSPGFSQENTFK